MSRIQCICVSLLLLSIVLVEVAAVRKKQHTEEANHQVFGRYTEQQVIELSRPLITDVLSSQDPLDLSAQPKTYTLHDGRRRHEWCIECTDRRTGSILLLVRDADTGQLCEISISGRAIVSPPLPNRLSAQDATAKARDWLALLGFLENWSVSGPPLRHGSTWTVTLQQDRRKAVVNLLGSDGSLLHAGISVTR